MSVQKMEARLPVGAGGGSTIVGDDGAEPGPVIRRYASWLPGRRWWAIEGGIVLGFFLTMVAWTWPMVLRLHSHQREPGDPMLTSWIFAWNSHNLLSHPLGNFDANIFWPEESTLAFADHMIGLTPIAAPFWWLTHNAIFTNNAVLLVLGVLAGWSMYLLVKELIGGRRWPAVAAGLLFAVNPYHVLKLSHTNLYADFSLPLAWYFALRLIRRGQARHAVGLAVAIVAAMGVSWYYLLYCAGMVVVVVVVEATRTHAWRRSLPLLAGAAVVVCGMAIIWGLPYVEVTSTYPEAIRSVDEAEFYSIHLSDFLAAPPGNRLLGDALSNFRQGAFIERPLFLGFTGLVLALLGIVRASRRRRFDLLIVAGIIGAASIVIAMGPRQVWFDNKYEMPYYYLYQVFPPIRFMRSVGRAMVMLHVVVAVLAGYALAGIRRAPDRAVICVAIITIALAESSVTSVLPEPALLPSPAHSYLAKAPMPGPVAELPMAMVRDGEVEVGSALFQLRYMSWSAQHWRPLLNGYSGFLPPVGREAIFSMQTFPDEESIRLLRQREVAYILVHEDLVPGSPWASLATPEGRLQLEAHGFLPVFRSGDAVVYRLRA